MRQLAILSLIALAVSLPPVFASVSEVEPNSTVGGRAIYTSPLNTPDATTRYVEEFKRGNPSVPDPTANGDPSLATPLSLTDEMVGQLGSTRDYDWFYVDISNTQNSVTPVYFSCDKKLGYYYESLEDFKITDPESELYWQIEYYYNPTPSDPSATVRQSSYVVYPDACRRGTAETKGPFRFQMNTQRPGRYYVRIWGRLVASGVDFKDTIVVGGVNTDRHTYYDIIATPTADYSLRLYTGRIAGELEPNDGMVEAYPLTAGNPVPGQLSSMYDQDWFYLDNDTSSNNAGKVNLYFSCKGQTNSQFLISSYNYLGTLQNSYQVAASQCNSSDGFGLSINTPVTARYYLQVSPPTYKDQSAFSQSEYSLSVLTKGSRLPGEMEPNDTRENAFPLSTTQSLIAQLYAPSDLDYYYLDVNLTAKSPKSQTIYFGCDPSASGAQYVLSTYNTQGSLQQNYKISGSQCELPEVTNTSAAKPGFTFKLPTPNSGRYYILVAGPTDNSAAYSNADYSLSTYLDASAQLSASTNGSISNATITDSTAANKDSFTLNLSRCGQKGQVKLSGKKLNLTNVDESTQVLVQIGQWSCLTSTRTLTQSQSSASGSTYVYPPPPVPTPKPVVKPKITGSN